MPIYRKGDDQFELEHRAMLQSEEPLSPSEKHRRSTVDKVLSSPSIKARIVKDSDHPIHKSNVGKAQLFQRHEAKAGTADMPSYPSYESGYDIGTHISGADILRNKKKDK